MAKIPFMDRWRKAWLPPLRNPPAAEASSVFMPVFWGTRDDARFTAHMESLAKDVVPGCHFADNLFTWGRNNSMLDDDAFMRAWSSNAESGPDKAIIWRRYILACAAYHAIQLDGDFVECGAYTGVGVKTVIDYLGGNRFPKTFWIYDLFEHDESMRHHAMPDHGPDLHERVVRKFQSYPQVKVLKGNIPDVFDGQSPGRVAYLHIDLNEAPAELAALDALFDRVVPGGIVILDDYEWAGLYRHQKLAEDPWFEARRYRVFPLPTGQGLVIKR
ncbi:MAG: TylF/MycF/NovP-related O-methyltransferase [Casimicrobiaceae bacterium]